MDILLIIAILAVILIVAGIILYNRLVRLRNTYENAFAQIDVQLKRRHDLIPGLVESVKGYMAHERETLEAVINARNQAEEIREKIAGGTTNNADISKLGAAEGALGSVLGRLFALSEAYPDLKANQSFLDLQEELTSTENRVAYARQAFNDGVLEFNNAVQTVPSNIVAGMFGFNTANMLEFEDRDEIQKTPKVSFQ